MKQTHSWLLLANNMQASTSKCISHWLYLSIYTSTHVYIQRKTAYTSIKQLKISLHGYTWLIHHTYLYYLHRQTFLVQSYIHSYFLKLKDIEKQVVKTKQHI